MPRRREQTTPKPAESSALFPKSLIDSINQDAPRAAQVYAIMRRAIVEMILAPGSIVHERLICEELGVSRTPLREALLRLQDESLVRIVPNSRTYVAKIELEAVFEGQLVRQALEMKLVRLAAVRMTADAERRLNVNIYEQTQLAADHDYERFYEADEKLHHLIAQIGASERVWRIVHSAKAQLDRVRRLAIPIPKHVDVVLEQHIDIVDGLRLRDADRAAAAMAVHLDDIFLTVRTLISEQRQLFEPDAESSYAIHSGFLRRAAEHD